MAKAVWNGRVVAESPVFEKVEGHVYFPPDALQWEYFRPSGSRTTCPWKGEASYWHLEVDGQRNEDAAWTYAEPKEVARNIRGYVTFWKGVKVEE